MMSEKKLTFLSSNLLRILAVLFMTIDHLWASLIPGNAWMGFVGRLAFPLFAFLIAEGFVHTSNRKKYILRILIFAVITEIPYDLFYGGTAIYPFQQNVLFTFLYALLAMTLIDKFREKPSVKSGLKNGSLLLLIMLGALITFPDYGFWGFMMAVMFYLVRDFPFAFLVQLAIMIYINFEAIRGEVIPMELLGYAFEFPKQGFAVFSLIPIWLYSGKKGFSNKIAQYGFYVYYPLHMLIIWLITRFI